MKHNQQGKSLRGASTIRQQVAKMYAFGRRVFLRKGLEVFYFLIEKLWVKKGSRMYLNVAEWERYFGAEAAAQHFFKKQLRTTQKRRNDSRKPAQS